MNAPATTRFFPWPIVFLCVAAWIGLTFFAVISEIAVYDNEVLVIVYGISITAFSMAFVAGWVSVFSALVLNWLMTDRRSAFRKELLEWTPCFSFITVIAAWSILFLGS